MPNEDQPRTVTSNGRIQRLETIWDDPVDIEACDIAVEHSVLDPPKLNRLPTEVGFTSIEPNGLAPVSDSDIEIVELTPRRAPRKVNVKKLKRKLPDPAEEMQQEIMKLHVRWDMTFETLTDVMLQADRLNDLRDKDATGVCEAKVEALVNIAHDLMSKCKEIDGEISRRINFTQNPKADFCMSCGCSNHTSKEAKISHLYSKYMYIFIGFP